MFALQVFFGDVHVLDFGDFRDDIDTRETMSPASLLNGEMRTRR